MGHVHIEQYAAREGGMALHIWTDVQGAKKENDDITGMPNTSVPAWFRTVLRKKGLADISNFPHHPS
jgi:hypothetical protein